MSKFKPEEVASVKNSIPCARHSLTMKNHSLGLVTACLYGESDEWGMDIQRRTYLRLKGYTHDELAAMTLEERRQLFEKVRHTKA